MNKLARPITFVFFGPDGSGKTTQAEMLVKHLRLRGFPVKHVWIRARHSVAFLLSKLLVKLGFYKIVKDQRGFSYKIVDPSFLRRMKTTWIFIEFCSVLPFIITRVYLPRALGFTIVAERYTVDTVVHLGYYLDHDYVKSYSSKILLSLIPKKSALFWFDAETNVLFNRLSYDEATPDFLEFQRKAYRRLAAILGARLVDTGKLAPAEASLKILASVRNISGSSLE